MPFEFLFACFGGNVNSLTCRMSIISCFLSFLQALIFSSMHVSGQQLTQLSGIAALLRFPLPDLEDQELDDAI